MTEIKGACREQVWNGLHGAVETKLICYASPVFIEVCTSTDALIYPINLYSFWSSSAELRLIELWKLTRIRRSIVTKCHPPITILFHWAGPGMFNKWYALWICFVLKKIRNLNIYPVLESHCLWLLDSSGCRQNNDFINTMRIFFNENIFQHKQPSYFQTFSCCNQLLHCIYVSFFLFPQMCFCGFLFLCFFICTVKLVFLLDA